MIKCWRRFALDAIRDAGLAMRDFRKPQRHDGTTEHSAERTITDLKLVDTEAQRSHRVTEFQLSGGFRAIYDLPLTIYRFALPNLESGGAA